MAKILDGYAFVQVNTFGVIQQTDKERFKEYSKLLKKFILLLDLFRTYRNVNIQFSSLATLMSKYDDGKIDPNTVFNISESSMTAYILMHRMFVDNCKSFQRKFENTNVSKLIIDLQNKSTEKNMKVLRDYAMHTSIPMSQVGINTSINYKIDSKQRFHSTLHVMINADRMNTHDLSDFDRKVIKEWKDDRLDITDEIKTAWRNLTIFAKKVFKDYLNMWVDDNLRQLVILDRKLWKEKLIPLKTTGIVYQPQNGIPQDNVLIDYDALAYFIECILNE